MATAFPATRKTSRLLVLRRLAPLLLIVAAACSPFAISGDGGLPPPASPLTATASPAVSTATTAPTLFPTASPTGTPTQTPTTTPSPTPTLHPMHILAQRQTPYPGSEIVIEEELDPGANYYRYDASYLSEGLKIYALLTVPYGETPPTGWPAIVFNHGYIPPDVYRTTERYIAYVDNLAQHGYIVFRIDYRGHDRSEGAAAGAYGSPAPLVASSFCTKSFVVVSS